MDDCRPLQIFVVDDQSDIADSTGALLRAYGHQATAFYSGRAVLDALDRKTPDVILSDIGMPDMDGCELAARVKQRPDCGQIILAAVTAFGGEEHRQIALRPVLIIDL